MSSPLLAWSSYIELYMTIGGARHSLNFPIFTSAWATEVSSGLAGTAEIARFAFGTERTLSNLAEADETFDAEAVRDALFRAAVAAGQP